MKGLIKRISKFMFKIIIADIILAGLAFVISYFSDMKISDIMVYAGIICILIGGLSLLGSGNNSADVTYIISKSAGNNSMNENTEENYKNRNNSMRFLIFMSCVGGFLLAIVALIDYIF
ncbi:hypothetical protein I5677_14695 [Mobilitalea sibirica]|uniref:Uncharacterized protein n=1 Tax=Mobilitalea sibirica TaxID=1462919 RepID=A0A8J7H469_9FIRM|nr:hypothetical protein [Mobilitalea sibirica]MBH1942148.1 hypothetical protein [Mobilitalea sibirica]